MTLSSDSPSTRRTRYRLGTILTGALLTVGGLPAAAGAVAAQCPVAQGSDRTLAGALGSCPGPLVPAQWPRPVSHAVDLAVNSALGALTAAVRARLAGRRFWPAFGHGAAGGAVVYVGKRIVGTQVPAVGILGREVAAVGASMVGNAGDGRALLGAAVLPFGIVRVYLGEPADDSGGARRVRLKLDLAGAVGLAYVATRSGARFDPGATVLAGAPVFDGVSTVGMSGHLAEHVAGVIALAPGFNDDRRLAIAHELIHVTQYDFTFVAWGEPFERQLAPHVLGGDLVHRYVDLGLNVPLIWLGDWAVPNDDQRPWEREAVLMTERPWP